MRRSIPAVLMLLLLSCMGRPHRLGRSAAVQNETAVAVSVICADASIYIGSGVALPDSRVLTAAHVVNACGSRGMIAILATQGETSLLVQVEAIAPRADVVRLEPTELGGPDLRGPPVELGPLPNPGEPVCVAAANPYVARRCGYVEYRADEPHGIRHSVIVEPGNSGAGLYDCDGRLVGIVTKLYTCGNGQICGGMATPLSTRGWVVSW